MTILIHTPQGWDNERVSCLPTTIMESKETQHHAWYKHVPVSFLKKIADHNEVANTAEAKSGQRPGKKLLL